jgi:hypothetical protein
MGLDTIDQSEHAIAAWMKSAPAEMRSSIHAELAYLHALEGNPGLAIHFSRERLKTKPECQSCRQILALMDGFEQRPHNLEDVVNLLSAKLVTLRHPRALQMQDPLQACLLRESLVPLAFAWICMQHTVKPNHFLSGREVSLLTERAVLAMAGWHRLGSDEVAKQIRKGMPHGGHLMKAGVMQGRDTKSLTTACMNRLSSVMQSIPVDDLFDATNHAESCLAGWCAHELDLSREQSLELVSSLPRTR